MSGISGASPLQGGSEDSETAWLLNAQPSALVIFIATKDTKAKKPNLITQLFRKTLQQKKGFQGNLVLY